MDTNRRIAAKDIIKVRAALLARQKDAGGVSRCPLCCTPIDLSSSVADHDHSTGEFRDALCRNCNGLEGKFWNLATRGRRGLAHKDYVGRVILYWIRHETSRTGIYHPLKKSDEELRVKRNAKARKVRAAKKATK